VSKILNSELPGDQVETQGHCPYCQQITTWLLTVKEPGVINFACQRCKKIERDVTVSFSDPGGQ
jgi:uncharacterized protein YwlG (UPF0340 family)